MMSAQTSQSTTAVDFRIMLSAGFTLTMPNKNICCVHRIWREGVFTLECLRHIFQNEHTPKQHCIVYKKADEVV